MAQERLQAEAHAQQLNSCWQVNEMGDLSMKARTICIQLILLISILGMGAAAHAYSPSQSIDSNSPTGQSSIRSMSAEWGLKNPECKYLLRPEDGGEDVRDSNDNPVPGFFNPAACTGAGPFGTLYPPTPAAAMGFKTESKVVEAMLRNNISGLGGFNGQVNSDLKSFEQQAQAANLIAKTTQMPENAAQQAKAQQLAQGIGASNAMGEAAKAQSASAIDFCSKYLQNFTAQDGNQWNQLRTNLFVPIGILLILPGALLTQIRAMMASGNPTLGEYNPFDGILRAIVAIFLVPATFFVVNYGIDFSNSITMTIASTYTSIFGSNMYKDALSAEIKAFPVRGPKENNNTGVASKWQQGQVNNREDFEKNFLENKKDDPASGTFDPEQQKVDEAMPSGAMASRMLSFVGNAGLTASWNILCAFQVAYLGYLFFVGPVVAGLWVWPIKAFREALPNWVEGVITICCWSLFWNTTILLMACFRGVDETGTTIMTALNFLSTASVKFAFDFSGLVRAAGAEATKAASQGGGGAQGGKGGKQGAQHGAHGLQHGGKPGHPAGHPNGPHHTLPHHSDNGKVHPLGPSLAHKENSEKLAHRNGDLANFRGSPNEGGRMCGSGGSDPAHPSERMASVHPSVEPPPLSALHQASHSEGKPHESSFQLDAKHQLSLHTGKNGEVTGASLHDEHGNVMASFNHDEIAAGGSKVLQAGHGAFAVMNEAGVLTFGAHTAEGGSHALMVDKNGNVSLHDGNKEINQGNLADHPKLDSIALQGNGESMFMDSKGERLFVRNAEGGFDSISLHSGDGHSVATLPDGRSVEFSRAQEGAGYLSTVSVMDSHGKVQDSFAVSSNGAGLANIQSVDQNGQISNVGFSTDGTTSEYRHFDANDNVLQRDVLTADGGISSYYNADGSGALVGTASWQSVGDTLNTLYKDGAGNLLASAAHEVRPDGSVLDSVRDAQYNLIASQEQYQNNNGTWSYEYNKFGVDGALLSSQISAFPLADAAGSNTVQNVDSSCVQNADFVQNYDASAISNLVQNADFVQNFDASTLAGNIQNVNFVQNADFVNNVAPPGLERGVSPAYADGWQPAPGSIQNADFAQNYDAGTISSYVHNADFVQNVAPPNIDQSSMAANYVQSGDFVQNYDVGTISSYVYNADFVQNVASPNIDQSSMAANYVQSGDFVQNYDAGTISSYVNNADFVQNVASPNIDQSSIAANYVQNGDYVHSYDAGMVSSYVNNADFVQNVAPPNIEQSSIAANYVHNADYVQNYDAGTISSSVNSGDFVHNYDAGTISNSVISGDFVQNVAIPMQISQGPIAYDSWQQNTVNEAAATNYVQNSDYVHNYDAGKVSSYIQNADYVRNNADYVQNNVPPVTYSEGWQQNAITEAAASNYVQNGDQVQNYESYVNANVQSIDYTGTAYTNVVADNSSTAPVYADRALQYDPTVLAYNGQNISVEQPAVNYMHNAEYVQNVADQNVYNAQAIRDEQAYYAQSVSDQQVYSAQALVDQQAANNAQIVADQQAVHNAQVIADQQAVQYAQSVEYRNTEAAQLTGWESTPAQINTEYQTAPINNPAEVEYMPVPYIQARAQAPIEEVRVVEAAAENIIPAQPGNVRAQVGNAYITSPRKVDAAFPPSHQKPGYVRLINEFEGIAKKADTLPRKKLNQILGKPKNINC